MAGLQTYFNTTHYKFHVPTVMSPIFSPLSYYLTAYRAAFDNLSIKRGLIVKESDYITCQTYIEGKIARAFTLSPVGKLPPNGKRLNGNIINIFRFEDQGRMIEEWVKGYDRILYHR